MKQKIIDAITELYRAEFAKVHKEFQASIKESLATYQKTCNDATVEYEAIQLPALKEYQKLLDVPDDIREKLQAEELQKYEAVQLPAFEIYRTKIREADEIFSKVLRPAHQLRKEQQSLITDSWLRYLKAVRNCDAVYKRLETLIKQQPEKPDSVYRRANTNEEIVAYRAGAFDSAVELARQLLKQFQMDK